MGGGGGTCCNWQTTASRQDPNIPQPRPVRQKMPAEMLCIPVSPFLVGRIAWARKNLKIALDER